ncbi:hypothetical protein IAQ61_003495 [Plenodomus lingam]|uniref:uncharacterized protein n=1 Tax=Leptosphaeria maculans TaxID=5022 RepID=UPI00331E3544|nr:hypothetical protein IAQ61_003495 [Plenodomus lingam]
MNATGLSKHVEISFDVPDNEAAICRLNFLINTSPQKNAPYSLSGMPPYALNISRLQPTINKDTDTWNSRPNVTDYMATYLLTQAGSVSTAFSKWFPCPKGQIAQFLLLPADEERDFEYYWFELDYPKQDGGPHGVVLEMHT